ncbi:ROK family transcriptional regulator [Streptomyces sp. 4N509B]|uniref:ROK family transcriptional regulator n=1 Tax=Streptomyces sp. 4N509B TaxID=3457413 RepID=UPI003FD4E299
MPTTRTASPRTARAINDRIALGLLAERGPLTAGQLRELTGLSRPSVADLLERLGRDGLVAVVGETGAQRRGPNARLFGLVADRAHVAALDVRTGGVSFTLADLAGETVAEATLTAGADGRLGEDEIVDAAMTALHEALRRAGVRSLHTAVVGAPGLADPTTGALRATGDLPGWHAELLTALRQRLGAPVVLENEVNLAAIAEHRLGAGRDHDTFVLMWLGEGIGAGVVLDGRLRRGASGGAGEIGFMPVPGTGGLPSRSDCQDGLHVLVSAVAVAALARRHGLTPAGPDAEAVAALLREVADAAQPLPEPRPEPTSGPVAGPEPAAEGAGAGAEGFLDTLAERLAVAAAAVTAVLDPGCVVLGGEIGRAGGDALSSRVHRRLATLSPLTTVVRPAAVAGNPVLHGALLTALDAARRDLFDPAGTARQGL